MTKLTIVNETRQDTIDGIFELLNESKAFFAVSITEDRQYRVHHFNTTDEEIVMGAELIKKWVLENPTK